jgi:hypothetical protein
MVQPATASPDLITMAAVAQRLAADPRRLATQVALLAGAAAGGCAGREPGRRSLPLLRTPAVEVELVGWAAGASTRAHDHGGAAGAWAVLTGELVEDDIDEAAWWARPARRRIGPGEPVLTAAERVHVVANPGLSTAVTVHVSGPASRPVRYPAVGVSALLAEAAPWPALA